MMSSSIGGMPGMSSAALAQMREQRFKELDADGSGEVSESEFAAGPSGSQGMDSGIASALFTSFDTDDSGGLSQDELETGFQKLSSSMRSVLIGTQEGGGPGGPGGPGGAGGPDGPPPPPPPQGADGGSSGGTGSSDTSGLDSLLSLLEGATGNDDSSDDDSSTSTGSAASAVKSDLKQLLNDLLKLTQKTSVGTQVTV
ncbi:MAG TPA: hypothetical protein VHA35_24565 [Dongiaceae bacterium]|nr:hypothetical protein [Dongiaceae bacterium]